MPAKFKSEPVCTLRRMGLTKHFQYHSTEGLHRTAARGPQKVISRDFGVAGDVTSPPLDRTNRCSLLIMFLQHTWGDLS